MIESSHGKNWSTAFDTFAIFGNSGFGSCILIALEKWKRNLKDATVQLLFAFLTGFVSMPKIVKLYTHTTYTLSIIKENLDMVMDNEE